ncbi:MAG TPA: alkaline shock response membrane anchor protein AmaP [bacterium]|nr:alkaline shock response membrane anchor protein AmaP [Candidatus Omnitrophota bacterium]HOJ61123.1 alkaline shock response membrane anchor protein AmaP [bacterium]HOL92811.1 alkaline shock response membrane anchor protein AmaP [bacterium]HPP00375.1 alkaline shock response membrane anchor protein AmaP [bacterium]
MKYLSLLLTFAILFCLCLLSWYIVFWDVAGLKQLSLTLLELSTQRWGKLLFIALGLISMGCCMALMAMMMGLEPGIRPHITIGHESGEIGMSLTAVEEFIKRKGQAISGVRDISVRADLENGGLSLKTKLVLELQQNIPEFTRHFQEKIQHELTETLGVNQIQKIEVLIKKILPRDNSIEGRFLTPPATVLLKDPDTESAPVENPDILDKNPRHPDAVTAVFTETTKSPKEES